MSGSTDFNKELERYIQKRKGEDAIERNIKGRQQEPDIDEETRKAIENYSDEQGVKVIERGDTSVWSSIAKFFCSMFRGSDSDESADSSDSDDIEEEFKEDDKEVEEIIEKEEQIEEEYKPKKGFFARLFGRTKLQEEELEEDIEELRRKCDEYKEDIDMLSSELKRTFKVTNSIITSLSDRYIEKIKKSDEFKEYKQIISRFNAYRKGRSKKE